MSKAEVSETPRRSMVGAPPTLSSMVAAPTLSSSPRPSNSKLLLKVNRKRPAKAKAVAESEENSATDADDPGDDTEERESGGEESKQDPSKAPKKQKKRKRLDNSVKAKRKAERKAAADKQRAMDADEVKEEASPEVEPAEESEPEPSIKKTSLNQYTPLQLLLDHLLRKMRGKDPEEFFGFPVTEDMAPDYSRVIENPMDFSTMDSKVEADSYTSIGQFRRDAQLIASNALTYNAENTVYHVAALRLIQVVNYYTGEPYLRHCSQRLPFASMLDWEAIGLPKQQPAIALTKNKRRDAIGKEITAQEILKSVNAKVAEKLASRLPNAPKLVFLDNKDGATVMNVIGEKEKPGVPRIIDLTGSLDEGNPGMFAPSDTKLLGQAPITYLNYGPFCSFAPQFDSTWATMRKRESDMLLRTYGERATATESLSLALLVRDSATHLSKMVDDMLDRLTDGEHSRTLSVISSPLPPVDSAELADLPAALADIESLSNLGIDVSFVSDLRKSMSVAVGEEPCSRLASSASALLDLNGLQQERLSMHPAVSLSRAPPPCRLESDLAANAASQLAAQVAQVPPGQLVSTQAIHEAMAISADDDLDFDILREFLVTQ